jgi:predicted DNA-binding transcriptional regulator YafY
MLRRPEAAHFDDVVFDNLRSYGLTSKLYVPGFAMSQLERIYKLDRLLRRKSAPSKREILAEFEISPAQFKRDLDFMRERLGAAITFDSTTSGYRYSSADFNLPGLWFSELEVYSMLLMYALLDQLQPGVVREQLEPFEAKLRALLGKSRRGTDSILERIRVTPSPQRPANPQHFQAICDATLRRKQLRMHYYARSRDAQTDRVVSPQRVVYYRGNWYLDAWCHDKQARRRFAIDAVREVAVVDEVAKELDSADVAEEQGYGIFAGPAEHTAMLMFDPEAARWVGEEEWHPHQVVTPLPHGGIQLEVPYSMPQEIMMDILRHGEHVEVIRPASLRSAVADSLRQAAEKYAPAKRSVSSAEANTGLRTVRAR